MRKKSRQMLDELSASNTRAALLAFWSDLRALDRDGFEAVISPSSKQAKRPKRAAAAPSPPADGPVQRISRLMLGQCALTPDAAALALRRQLGRVKVPASRVPPFQGGDFESWLVELFKMVPSSKVLHAAVALCSEAGSGVR
jgi:hypothetical protein